VKTAAILVNYRDASGIAAAARSVRDHAADVEIVVVDNSDDPAHWKALREALPAGVIAVNAGANLGFGRGCNLALCHTDAALLMLVNPDVRLRPGCIAALRETLTATPRLAAVAPRQSLDERGEWLLPPAWLPTALRAWATEKTLREPARQARWRSAIRAEHLRCWRANKPLRQRALSGAALMVRRDALAATATAWGLRADEIFDPRFFMYFEDSDLSLRLRRGGWQLALVPQALAVHAWRNAPHKEPLMRQGMQAFFDKHHGPGDPWQTRRAASASGGGASGWALDATALTDPWLTIEAGADESWCLQVSPSPTLWPAVGRLGRGRARIELDPVLEALSGGNPVWIEVSPETGSTAGLRTRRWRWSISDGAGAARPSASAP
jgi:GT2 family glycosyltransferase